MSDPETRNTEVNVSKGRSKELRNEFLEFFLRNNDAFVLDDCEKGTTNIVIHKIDTRVSISIRRNQVDRIVTDKQKEEVSKPLDRASSIVLVKKRMD